MMPVSIAGGIVAAVSVALLMGAVTPFQDMATEVVALAGAFGATIAVLGCSEVDA